MQTEEAAVAAKPSTRHGSVQTAAVAQPQLVCAAAQAGPPARREVQVQTRRPPLLLTSTMQVQTDAVHPAETGMQHGAGALGVTHADAEIAARFGAADASVQHGAALGVAHVDAAAGPGQQAVTGMQTSPKLLLKHRTLQVRVL